MEKAVTSAPHISLTPKAIKFQGLCLILPITVTEHVTENNFEEEERSLIPDLRKGTVHHGRKECSQALGILSCHIH